MMKTIKIKDNQFIIQIPYDINLVNLIKLAFTGGRSWNPGIKSWVAPINDKNFSAVNKLNTQNGFFIDDLTMQELEKRKEILEIEKDRNKEKIEMSKAINADIEIPKLKLDLYPFQKAGVKFIDQTQGKTLLADAMGLGKTAQAIAWTTLYPTKRPILVVCPATLKINWQREIKKWTDLKSYIINSQDTNFYLFDHNYDAYIINYDILEKKMGLLQKMKYQIMILDEAHFTKNPKAKRTKAINELSKSIPHILALTGTPILNRPIEIYNILKILDPKNYGNYWGFAKRYAGAYMGKWGMDVSGATNIPELAEKLRSTVMIRREKEDVLADLPPKNRVIIPQDIDMINYKKVENDLINYLIEQKNMKRDNASQKVNNAEQLIRIEYCKQEAVKAKFSLFLEWVKDFFTENEKLVIFAHHREYIEKLMVELQEFNPCMIIGGMNLEDKQKSIDTFQNDLKCKVIICSIKAAGIGITLTAATYVAFLELGWTTGDHDQAEDRCIFEGQKVLTKRGYINIENINIGDYILSHKGNWKQILDINSKLERKKLQINIKYFGFNESLNVTEDHKIYIYDKEKENYEWIEAINLKPRKHYIVLNPGKINNLGIDYLETESPFKSTFKNNFDIIQKNGRMNNILSKIKLSNDLLFSFGFYIANGHGRYNINPSLISVCDSKDKKSITLSIMQNIVNSFFNAKIKINEYEKKEKNIFSATIYSKNLAYNFINWFGKGAENKQFPEWVFRLNKEQIQNLLNGYFAGDGYVRKNIQQGFTVSNKLISQLIILNALIGNTIMGVGYKEKSKVWTIGYSINTKTRVKINNDGNILFPISEINIKLPKRGKDRVYDLTIEDDHSFVVGLSSVHNCHRIGQKGNVSCYYFLAENTIEETIYNLIQEKRKIFTQLMQDKQIINEEKMNIFNDLVNKLVNK